MEGRQGLHEYRSKYDYNTYYVGEIYERHPTIDTITWVYAAEFVSEKGALSWQQRWEYVYGKPTRITKEQ